MANFNLTEQNLPVLEDLPPFIRERVGEFGIVEHDSISHAAELAGQAFKSPEALAADPDTIESLRKAVNTLSDALATVSGQLSQIETGIRTGRIAAAARD
jgi:hypothetical protein